MTSGWTSGVRGMIVGGVGNDGLYPVIKVSLE